MSSFLHKGQRDRVRAEKRKVKQHMKSMYRILGEVKELALDIHNAKEEWTEDNIIEIAARYTEIEIADMEKFLLLGNLQMLKDEIKSDNAKEH